jgi:O-antigen ligase/tetratricopeptide (TPR) repeat protein
MLRDRFCAAGGSSHRLDRLVNGGLMFLLVFTPLAMGSAHQWAFALMEAVIFVLVIAWMAKVWIEALGPLRAPAADAQARRIALPAALFALLVGFELAPLPPTLLRAMAPATYQLYQVSLLGWPRESPYQALLGAWKSTAHAKPPPTVQLLPPASNLLPPVSSVLPPAPKVLPPVAKVLPPVSKTLPSVANADKTTAKAAPGPAHSDENAPSQRPAIPGSSGDRRWLSLSIAPSVTWSGLIELLSLGSLLFLVMLYPFGFVGEREAETRFYRRITLTVLLTGLGIAVVGLVERAWWNGRILWIFVPRDWVQPMFPTSLRASGPFVDPDHFANYLGMVLPLAVVGSLFALPIVSKRRQPDLRLVCAVASFAMVAGILLSLSRGAWIAAAIGVCAGLALAFKYALERAPEPLKRLGGRALPLSLAGLLVLLVVTLYLVGPGGRSFVGERFDLAVVQGQDLSQRPAVWKDTLDMIRDFPVFGVGLGCWPEIFPHYQRPPWSSFFSRKVENDYLQLIAETGIAGLALFIWFAFAVVRKFKNAALRLSVRQLPLYAGLLAGLAALAVHEVFDFSFQTPANAFLATILLGLALRIAMTRGGERDAVAIRPVATRGGRKRAFAACAITAAILMTFAAFAQDGTAYPYDIVTPTTLAGAEATVVAHPASSIPHLDLISLFPPAAPPALRQREQWAAVWLDPNQPLVRDIYAQSLLLSGNKKEGLRQISLSVAHSPVANTHYYLEPRLIEWLLPDEQAAIANGFEQAVSAGVYHSLRNFADFYAALGRYEDAARMHVEAAGQEASAQSEMELLVAAGQEYSQADDYKNAEGALRRAIAIAPDDPKPYAELMRAVLGPQMNLRAAWRLVDEGVANGVDPYQLNLALARLARSLNDHETAESAYLKALKYQPSFEATLELGQLYIDETRFPRAVLTLDQATDLNPQSAPAFFSLGQAEEGNYDYSAAEKAYARATQLDPENRFYRAMYLDFQRRTAKSASGGPS